MKATTILSYFILSFLFIACGSSGSHTNCSNKSCISNALAIAEASLQTLQLNERTTLRSIVTNSENSVRTIESIDISGCGNEFQVKFKKLLSVQKEGLTLLKSSDKASMKKFDRKANELNSIWKELKLMKDN